jgi:hypothetical protein
MESTSVQTYARLAAVLLLLSMIGGFFGEFYVPSRLIVSRDAAATARNIVEFDTLLRWGFAGYLLEAVCDIALSWVLYVLLRPVHKNLALLAAFFGLVSTATFAIAELFLLGTTLILGGGEYLKVFSQDQLNSLAYLWIRMSGLCAGIFMLFYGIASVTRGYLIFRSGYLPRAVGVLLMFGGLGFIARNFVVVLAPAYESDVFLLPMFVAGVSLTGWMLFRGVDVAKWEAKAETI